MGDVFLSLFGILYLRKFVMKFRKRTSIGEYIWEKIDQLITITLQ